MDVEQHYKNQKMTLLLNIKLLQERINNDKLTIEEMYAIEEQIFNLVHLSITNRKPLNNGRA